MRVVSQKLSLCVFIPGEDDGNVIEMFDVLLYYIVAEKVKCSYTYINIARIRDYLLAVDLFRRLHMVSSNVSVNILVKNCH